MNKLLVGCMVGALSLPAQAFMYIFTPGQPAKAVVRNGDDYMVIDMGGAETTRIMDLGGMTAITGGGRPTSFIMDGGELGREQGGVVPGLDPNTGTVDPQINLQPEELRINFEDWH